MVGFDPRGSARRRRRCGATPTPTTTPTGRPAGRLQPAGVEHIETTEKQYAQRCIDKMGKDFLANVGTANVVRTSTCCGRPGRSEADLPGLLVRHAIGAAYAEAFPDKVRAMILDGAVDPNADPIQANIDQAAAFQKAFDELRRRLRQTPGCPLGTDPAKAVAAFQDMVNPLVSKPGKTTIRAGWATLTERSYCTARRQDPPEIARGIRGRGDFPSPADAYMNRDDKGHYTNSTDALIADQLAWTSRRSRTGRRPSSRTASCARSRRS